MPEPELSRGATADGPPELGRALCRTLCSAARLTALWTTESRLALDAVDALLEVLRQVASSDGEAVVEIAPDAVLVNGRRLADDPHGLATSRNLVELLGSRRIGAVRFGADVRADELAYFLGALGGTGRGAEDPCGELLARLDAVGIASIRVEAPREAQEQPEAPAEADLREVGIQSYFRGVFLMDRLLRAPDPAGALELRRLKRVVHGLVDALAGEESTLLALTAVKGLAGYVPTHAVNVCVLAVVMGARLDLPKPLLGQLGLAALLHDVGRSPDGFDDGHALRGAQLLLGSAGFGDAGLRAVLAARGHHEAPFDLDGTPAPLFHRIVAVADFYDTVTTPAGITRPPLAARDALRLMIRDDGRHFDRRVVKLLASVVGDYPVGTVVRLDTGERGVVSGRNPHFDAPGRPMVRIVSDARGGPVQDGPVVDLSAYDREAKAFARSIVEAEAPSVAYASLEEYLATL